MLIPLRAPRPRARTESIFVMLCCSPTELTHMQPNSLHKSPPQSPRSPPDRTIYNQQCHVARTESIFSEGSSRASCITVFTLRSVCVGEGGLGGSCTLAGRTQVLLQARKLHDYGSGIFGAFWPFRDERRRSPREVPSWSRASPSGHGSSAGRRQGADCVRDRTYNSIAY